MTAAPSALVRRLDRALTAPGPPRRLVLVHAAVALVIGIRLLGRDWRLVAERPAVLTDRLSLVGWMPAPVPTWLLVTLQVLGIAGVALVLLRRAPRGGFALAWATYTLLAGSWGASGKVMHNDVLTVTVGAVLLLASVPPRGAATPSVRWGWPPRAALAVVATVYLLTGAQKVRHSGIAWVTSDTMSWVLRQGTSPFGPELTTYVADHPWLPHLLAGGALALELAAPVLLALSVTRLPFAVAAATMHTSIWAFLGLDYSAWVLTVVAVVVPMALPARAWARPPTPPRWRPAQSVHDTAAPSPLAR